MRWRLGLGRLPPPLRRRRLRPVVQRLSKAFTRFELRRARAGRGTVGGWVAGGVPVLLLTTTGRVSGRPHTTPLLVHRERDGSMLLVAVNGTADWDPDWLRNLRADARASVEVGSERHDVVATVLDGAERAAAWEDARRALPGLEPAQAACRRTIPLVRLAVT